MTRWRVWVSKALVFTGFILIAAGGLLIYIDRATAQPRAAPLPEQLAGMPRITQRLGPTAAEEIAGMHRNPFPMSAAAVGEYRGPYRAQLWVSGMPLPWMATRMVRTMARRIAILEDQPFRLARTWEQQGIIVYQATGLGQVHLFFATGPWVVWIGVDPPLAAQALDEALAFYRTQR